MEHHLISHRMTREITEAVIMLGPLALFILTLLTGLLRNFQKKPTGRDVRLGLLLFGPLALCCLGSQHPDHCYVYAARRANEDAAGHRLRDLCRTQQWLHDLSGTYASRPEMLDPHTSTPFRFDMESRGYWFRLIPARTPEGAEMPFTEGWAAVAEPCEPGETGSLWFYIDQTEILRSSHDGPAGPTSDPCDR